VPRWHGPALAARFDALERERAEERVEAAIAEAHEPAPLAEHAEGRALTLTEDPSGIPFFDVLPYATTAIYDTEAVGPVRFVFQTSDLSDYDVDEGVDMQLIIDLQFAEFLKASDCADVLDATNEFPALRSCYFSKQTGRITLQKPLKRNTRYSITIKMKQPDLVLPDLDGNYNSFTLATWFYQLRKIEYTKYPIEMTHTQKRADHPDYDNEYDLAIPKIGYVTEFTLIAHLDDTPGAETTMRFGIKSMGRIDKEFSIDIVAHPTDIWDLGEPGDCDGYQDQKLITGSDCVFMAFAGTSPEKANGMRLLIGNTPMWNKESTDQPWEGTFAVRIKNPPVAANMRWVATSVKDDDAQVVEQRTRPKSVLLDRPVSVIGKPLGRLSSWEYSAVNAEQWVVLDVFPGNTLTPFRQSKESAQTSAGKLIVTPAPGFLVVDSMPPQSDPSGNSFSGTWIVDKAANSWELQLAEIAAFGSTTYRVRLNVKNSPEAGAAFSWGMQVVDAT
jgi:hypothetical protein